MLFFNDTATTGIYTLSLHDALPISGTALTQEGYRDHSAGRSYRANGNVGVRWGGGVAETRVYLAYNEDRKSTRLNSSHANISYAVFCLKKTKCIFASFRRIGTSMRK